MDAVWAGDTFRHVTFVNTLVTAGRPARPVPVVPRPPGSLPRRDVGSADPFLIWLFDRCGLKIRHYRPDPLQRRLPACWRALGVDSTHSVRKLLERRPELLRTAVDTILIGVSAFSREPVTFEFLEQNVLPNLLQEKCSIACWSAGCSNGAELYSLAIVLAELGALDRCILHGTDCRATAIAQARAGQFAGPELAVLPPARRKRYFLERGGRAVAIPALRQATTWVLADVFDTPEGGSWDIIFCRNLTIYLQSHATALLWTKLYRALRPGGILIVGKAEYPADRHRWVALAPSIFRKTVASEAALT